MSGIAPPSSSIRPFDERDHRVLLGLRLLLVADLTRLLLGRWNAFDSSLRMLEAEGFPTPELWLSTALLAGGIGTVMLLTGERIRWGAALTLLVFLPVSAMFSVSYVPTGWPLWIAPVLPLLALIEDLLLGFVLTGIFFFGAGRYTLTRALREAGRHIGSLKQKLDPEGVPTAPQKHPPQ